MPAYPGAPPYGAALYAPDGTPLYPAPPPGAPPQAMPGTPLPGGDLRGTGRTLTRVVLFAAMCFAFMLVLVTVLDSRQFRLQRGLSNVSGLKGGRRIAGVEVGKVGEHDPAQDGTVTVEFAIDKNLTLTEGTRAAVRYENLTGDRYLLPRGGCGLGPQTQPGQTIVEQTAPALDIDALLGGFRHPRAGSWIRSNALSGELLRVFQGQGGTVSSVLSQTSALTSTLAAAISSSVR